jgi:hypothetical protein
MLKYVIPTFLAFLTSCVSQNTSESIDENDPQYIIDQSINYHGGEKYTEAKIDFTFRDREYKSIRKGGIYQYERIFTDEEGNAVRDILTNDDFVREINGAVVQVPDTMATKYSNSVNSVIYFAMLPFGLNAPAVHKTSLGMAEIKGKSYHKIKVTFSEEGGGEDFEDQFIYWFDTQTYEMTYLAYLYYTEGGGIRFRVPYNQREINGIRFQDYINHKADFETVKLEEVDRLYNEGKLEELSRIELEAVNVE